MANFTLNIHIGQEVHFDLQSTVARTGFTTSTFNIEGEPTGFIPANFGFLGISEKVPHMIEDSRISSSIGTRRPTNRRLINVYDFIQLIQTIYATVPSRDMSSAVALIGQYFVQDLIEDRKSVGQGSSG